MKKFIDEIYLTVQSGSGGSGAVSFERSKYKPIGRPNGGDGARGGHVILKVDTNLSELSYLKKTNLIRAKNGGNGADSHKRGKDGEDVFLDVPPGVLIKDYRTKELIAELIFPGQEYIIVHGGWGGKGNAHFKSSTNRSPRRRDEGKKGEERKIIIELKLLADIGFVGFPNAGKSTLLKSLTDAKPDINDYPFTTLTPNLGVFYDENHHPYTIADIPGIIEEAHKGKGLGLRFLKHIERTRILAFIIDVSDPEYKKKEAILNSELSSYSDQMMTKQFILIGNKIDLVDDPDHIDKNYIRVSALKNENLEDLKKAFIKALK
ncbi:MAG: GTPase ObgE [Spirochaetes bacterium]|nr:GTPase ObgE [Spirochaetota bacterium]